MSLRELVARRSAEVLDAARPLVIAEAGVNHEGDMELALRLIEEAHRGGADAVKFQTYRASTIASRHSPSYWDTDEEPTTSQFELFRKYDKFWKTEFETLREHCDQVGVEFLSTPFDIESAGFLNDLMEVFKISSSDITNRPFIEHVCGYGKPILLSTGASFRWEIEEALEWIAPSGVPVALLHCVLNYPTADEDANLAMITDLRRHFPDHVIGYSDHTVPRDMETLEVAALLGARILEKHFTHDKSLPGNDHYHAMDWRDLQHFRARMERVQGLCGSGAKRPLAGEQRARDNARRSLVAARAIPQDKTIDAGDLTWKRPASGISPREIGTVVGRRAARAIEADEVLVWDLLRG